MKKSMLATVLVALTALTVPQPAWSAEHLVSARDIQLRLPHAARTLGGPALGWVGEDGARLATLDDGELRDLTARAADLDADPAAAGAGKVALIFLALVAVVVAVCLGTGSSECTR